MKKTYAVFISALLALALLLCACGAPQNEQSGQVSAESSESAGSSAPEQESSEEPSSPAESEEVSEPEESGAEEPVKQIPYRLAGKDEGRELLINNEEYHGGFSQNELDFKMQKVGTTMEEYLAFAAEQTLDFTEEEAGIVAVCFGRMERTLAENGYALPPLDEAVIVKTTMAEESGAAGYTHGTVIFLGIPAFEYVFKHTDGTGEDYLTLLLWHELFHCLTRCNPQFRSAMYNIIHFTVGEEDYPLPPSVFEYHISNPDVEHHDSSAIFRIDGRDVECFTDFVTTKHFETEGDTFFSCCTTALVPTDGTDIYYTPEQAENFYDVFGNNTGYVVDPEECLADNFSLAMTYGTAGKNGEGYKNPEIIEAILAYLTPTAK
ncbi:MAG: hypothetical protein IK047_04020 [Clostridia bacterium]|nr:hypothetical protein [Clostridia bacterium]